MRIISTVYVLLFIAHVVSNGQTFGSIAGEVKDSTGAVIQGAQVTITNVDTNAKRVLQTNEAGLYAAPSLPPGNYRVRVEATGFKATTRTDIHLQVQLAARIDFTMEVGQVTESVEVAANAVMLTTEDATVGTVIEGRSIVNLPLNGRNFLQLVATSPNVSYDFGVPGQAGGRQGGTRASQTISLSGMRGTWNRFTLDGIENTDVNFNLYVMLPSIDALQEFKVQSGIYPAEFGRAAGQINVSTKPGTNDFHGAVFEFLRNDKLDARQYSFQGTKSAKTPFRWNQYGFAIGGPVWIPKVFNGKNKLFFMANYEAYRDRKQFQNYYTTPTVAMRNGDFSYALPGNQLYDPKSKAFAGGALTGTPFANNQVPKTRFDPISVKMLEFWPEPNINTAALSNNFFQNQPRSIDKDQFNLRADFNESASSQWFFRYGWTDELTLNSGLKLSGNTIYTPAKQYMLANTRVFGANKVNEFRFGLNHFNNLVGLELSGQRDVVGELGIPGLKTPDPITWGIPRVTNVVGVSGFGNDSSGPFAVNDTIFQWMDNFSWTFGKHSIKFGGELRRDRYNQKGNEFARGSFEFNGVGTSNPFTRRGGDSTADLLLGSLSRGEAALWLAFAQYRATSAYFYIDDTYRVAPKLTITMGLRYELTPPWLDRSQNMVNAVAPAIIQAANVQDKSLHPVLVRPGSGDFYKGKEFIYPGVPVARDGRLGDRLMYTDKNNLAPRLGIAFSPSGKWTFRTGAGIFYSVESGNSRFDMNRGMAGRVARNGNAEVPDLTYQNFLTAATLPWVLPPSPFLWGVKPGVRDSYSFMYLFNIQRQLDANTVLEVGYNGSLSRRLQGLQDTNAPIPGTTGSQNSRTPFPEFGILQTVHSEGKGSYSGLGMKLTRRTSAGVSYLASYTWSKSLDDASNIRGTNVDIFPQDSYCLRCDRGYSAFNTPHRLVTSVLWELPFGKGRKWVNQGGIVNQLVGGWQVISIVTGQSGRPLNMQSGFDISGTYKYGEVRQSATGQDPYLPKGQRGVNQWFNKSAFTLPQPGGFGNISRNRLIGPASLNWDFSTLKNFPIREGKELQFRFEAFNFPNHPNFGAPNLVWGSRDPVASGPNFGTIRSMSTMREMQFALKFIF